MITRKVFNYIVRIVMGLVILVLGITEDHLYFKIIGLFVGLIVIIVGIWGIIQNRPKVQSTNSDFNDTNSNGAMND